MPGDDPSPDGVLFDVDGTLVDTNYLHAVCWVEALSQHGHEVPTATVHRAIGMGTPQLLEHLLGPDRNDEDEQLADAHQTLYRQHWGRLRALPGARELLQRCAQAGLRVGLASSASDSELAALRSALDADEWIEFATSSDDAAAGKPAPEILQAALERAELDARRCVFVGDSVWDGQAAARAGIRFVGLTCGGSSEAELRENGALQTWRDPADLLARPEHGLLACLRRS